MSWKPSQMQKRMTSTTAGRKHRRKMRSLWRICSTGEFLTGISGEEPSGGDGSPDGVARKHRAARAREAVEILAGCRDDIRAVWADPLVQEMLRRRRFVIESIPGL